MKRRNSLIIMGSTVVVVLAGCFVLSHFGHFSLSLPVEQTDQFIHAGMDQFPSPLAASGNQLVDERGEVVRLRGIMAPDPAVLDERGSFNREYYARIAATGVNVIRVPVHPPYWVEHEDYLWRYLDPIVGWAGELGMYMIIDWHYIGNLATGAGSEMPDLAVPPMELSLNFWNTVAAHYQDTPHVIFEVFNEPQSITSDVWRDSAQQLVETIRALGAEQLVIVGGIDYSRDLSWVMAGPINDQNVAYTSHIYPSHPAASWDMWFGEVSTQYPVLMTEWGFMDENYDPDVPYLSGSEAAYGAPLMSYLDSHGIGWVACWWDDDWAPQMFAEGMQTYTNYGEFVIQQLVH